MTHKDDYLYELDLSYDSSKLKKELIDLKLEPYFTKFTDWAEYYKVNTDPANSFEEPDGWTVADVPITHGTEINAMYEQVKELIGANDVLITVTRQKANTDVSIHNDRIPEQMLEMFPEIPQIQCAINLQLNNPVGPIDFPSLGSLETYKCAILNVLEDHGVPAFETDRYFIKFIILDVSYKEAINNYLRNKRD
jgi:hypothetical protein